MASGVDGTLEASRPSWKRELAARRGSL